METSFSAVLDAVRAHEQAAGRADDIEVRQTHASVVFLTETEVFKLKKSVDFGFLDYSTPRRRALMCRREVEVNRRLAPDVYLGVLRLTATAGRALEIEGRGPVVDYLVHMSRLPDDASLASLIACDAVTPSQIEAIARRLAAFHGAAPLAPSRHGSLATVARIVNDNFDALGSFAASVIPTVTLKTLRAFTRDFMRENAPVFRARVESGHIRECHGDLRAEHVYLAPRLEIIDAIEFNRRLQCIDVANDIAFLAMDLDAHGARDLSSILIDAYREASGDALDGLLAFYGAYRAVVRAKVAGLRSLEQEISPPDRHAAMLEALRFGHLAWRYATDEHRPALAVMVGLTGTGKSTLAHALGDVLSARIVNADETRKRLAGLSAFEHREAEPDAGLYAPEMNTRVYSAMLETARGHLDRGRNVILDATFRRRLDRAAAASLATASGAGLVFVECTTAPGLIRERLHARSLSGDPWSDGRWEIYLAQQQSSEPLTPPERQQAVSVDTSLPELEQVQRVVSNLEQRSSSATAPAAPRRWIQR